MQEYKDELIKKAEVLITTGFPEKIVELNELLATKEFKDRHFQDVFQVSSTCFFSQCLPPLARPDASSRRPR